MKDDVWSSSACLELRAGAGTPKIDERGAKQEKVDQRVGEKRSGGEGSEEDKGGREDERWVDALSFDPSLSDAPFNVLTETTWGTPMEAVCLLISTRGEGYHLAIDGCQPPSPPHRGD